MVASQLSVYNGALFILSERAIASLAEDRDVRYFLDYHWSDGKGLVNACLEEGYWTFATRTSKLLANPNITPPFGYSYAFSKPDDYVKTSAICVNEFFSVPLTEYDDEQSLWFANVDTLYIKYISDDPLYGANFSLWPQSFNYFTQAMLAKKACGQITKSEQIFKDVKEEYKKALANARGKDCLNQPAKFMPAGTWSRARRSNRYGAIPQGTFSGTGRRDY